MKIKELPTERGLDVLVEITPHVKALAKCDNLIDTYATLAKKTEAERTEPSFAADALDMLIPVWLKECRSDILAIIRIIDDKTDAEIAEMGALNAFARISELFGDIDFMSFFMSFVERKPTK